MTAPDKITDAERAVLRAAHHYHCRDTGCFDGDDISHPELLEEIRHYGAGERAAAYQKAEELAEKAKVEGWTQVPVLIIGEWKRVALAEARATGGEA